MTQQTRRIPVDPEYVSALGYALYCFCYLEWNAIWIIERFEAKYIHKLPRKTAGQVADHLKSLVARARGLEESTHNRLIGFATLFKELVERRNSLVHAEPFTGENGEQRLSYPGEAAKVDWTLAEIIFVGKQFESASIEAGELFHKYLAHRKGARDRAHQRGTVSAVNSPFN